MPRSERGGGGAGLSGVRLRGEWVLEEPLGQGSFGDVYRGRRLSDGLQAAVKLEQRAPGRESLLCLEVKVSRKFSGQSHAPGFYASGSERLGEREVLWLAMELLGPSLSDLRRRLRKPVLSQSTGLRLLRQGVEALREFHGASGFVHRDLKPGNLLMGLGNARLLVLIDFGLARRFTRRDGSGTRRARLAASFRGSLRYASANAHAGLEIGRQDDLWSLLYVLLDLMGTALPWAALPGTRDNMDLIGTVKRRATADELMRGLPPRLLAFPQHLEGLAFESRPDYAALEDLLQAELAALRVTDADDWDWDAARTFRAFLRRSFRSSDHSRPSNSLMPV